MRLTFVSNYINHHQIPISNELFQRLKENYHFVQTQPMEEERVQMGWQEALEECPYVRNYWENEKECKTLILESDVVIFGGVEEESYLADRLEAGKIVIRYSERIYRNGLWRAISPRGLMKKYHDHVRYRNAPVYLLCSGAYVAFDFSLIHAYPNKKYKWGYFPKTKEYEIAKLLEKKSSDVTKLLWVSRLIELKHPEWIILLARELKLSINEKFQIEMVGDGPLRHSLEILIEEYGVSDVVHLVGAIPPEEVRTKMEEANIFLFTSDFREGWGAVLNESMNSGCAIVANNGIGAVPFLIEDGWNGFVYENNNREEFYAIVKRLIDNLYLQRRLGENAYATIHDLWNEKVAAGRLLEFANNIWEGKPIQIYEKGPLSEAPSISPRKMYEYVKQKVD